MARFDPAVSFVALRRAAPWALLSVLALVPWGCGGTPIGHEVLSRASGTSSVIAPPEAEDEVLLRPLLGSAPRGAAGPAAAAHVDPRLQVRFFAAGHGLAVLLTTPDGHAVLVDAGRGRQELLGDNLVLRRIVPHLQSHGIRRLDAWIVTHPHFDHYGDPESLGAAVRIERVILNTDGELWLGPRLARELGNVPIEVAHRGWELRLGRLHLKVLHPAPDAAPPYRTWGVSRHNNRSLVIRASFGNVRFLLMGDVLFRGERALMRALRKATGSTAELRADVLQLGHHGIGSGQPSFLRQVQPRFAVASLGDAWRGWDRLPFSQSFTLARRGIRLLRTDVDGDVLFLTDGVTLEVDTLPEHIHVPDRLRQAQLYRAFRRQRRGAISGPFGLMTYGLVVPDRPAR